MKILNSTLILSLAITTLCINAESFEEQSKKLEQSTYDVCVGKTEGASCDYSYPWPMGMIYVPKSCQKNSSGKMQCLPTNLGIAQSIALEAPSSEPEQKQAEHKQGDSCKIYPPCPVTHEPIAFKQTCEPIDGIYNEKGECVKVGS